MKLVKISGDKRETLGSRESKRAKRNNLVPATLYGLKKDQIIFTFGYREIEKMAQGSTFFTNVFEITVDGKTDMAIVKSVQRHSITDKIIHVDFARVKNGESAVMTIPLEFANYEKCPALKREGTALNISKRNINLEFVKFDNVPNRITINLEQLTENVTLYLKDLDLPKDAKPNDKDDMVILAISARSSSKLDDDEEETAEGETEGEEEGKEEGKESKSGSDDPKAA